MRLKSDARTARSDVITCSASVYQSLFSLSIFSYHTFFLFNKIYYCTTDLVILEPTDNPLSNDNHNDNIQLPSEKVSLLRNIKLSFIKCLTDCSCKQ